MTENDETAADEPMITQEEHTKQQRNRLLSSLDKIEAMNRDTMEQLQRRGNQPNPLALTRIRTELLISSVLGGQDSLQRLQFELVWQNELRNHFASMMQEANEKKIHLPGQN